MNDVVFTSSLFLMSYTSELPGCENEVEEPKTMLRYLSGYLIGR